MTARPTGGSAAALASVAIDWYAAHGRALAFRRTADPWAVLVSEVMAQQTQAARAAEAWSAFIERYPTPAALAATPPAEAIRAWRGLGYNRRAVALRAAAVRMVENHAGKVPDSLEALLALPGIGPYTARAVLAIAFGRQVAPLDTNVRRVLARALGVLAGPAREVQSVADGFVPAGRSAEWTHSLMDIGATFCRKREPRCEACPLASLCRFAANAATTDPATRPGARPTPRFESTTRWLRGRILDRLRDAGDGEWIAFDSAMGDHDADRVRAALAALASQGLLESDPAAPWRARLPA